MKQVSKHENILTRWENMTKRKGGEFMAPVRVMSRESNNREVFGESTCIVRIITMI